MESEVRVFRGPAGRGNVRFNKKVIKVTSDGGDSWEISYDNFTAEIPDNHKQILNGVYFSLNHDETELRSIRPPDGVHVGEFGGFTRGGEDNELGTFMKKRPAGKNDDTGAMWPARPEEERFWAILNVVAGDWKGYYYIYWLPYIFSKVQGAQVARLYGTQTRVDRMEEFLELCGIPRDGPGLDISIPWSADQGAVLEFLEETLRPLAKNNRFNINADNGWPSYEKGLIGLASGTTVA